MGLFSRKKKELKIPAPPPAEELPSFPMPKKLDLKPQIEAPTLTPLEEAKQKVVEKEKKELAERDSLKIYKPIFVNVHAYKAMIDEVTQLKGGLERADEVVTNLEGFKEDQDAAFKKWIGNIKNIHEKLIYVDETIFKSR